MGTKGFFFKDGQDFNMFIVEKGSSREGEMEGLEERGVADGTRSCIKQDGKDLAQVEIGFKFWKDSLSVKAT